jgi:uncharacterized protein YpmB
MDKKLTLIMGAIILILVVIASYFIFSNLSTKESTITNNETETIKQQPLRNEEDFSFKSEESSYYKKICKAAFDSELTICKNIEMKEIYKNKPDDDIKEEELVERKVDCMMKAATFANLINNNQEMCNKLESGFNSLELENLKQEHVQFMKDKCIAEFSYTPNFEKIVEDYSEKYFPYKVNNGTEEYLKTVKLVKIYYEQRDERFCTELFSFMGPYCKAILTKNSSMCS